MARVQTPLLRRASEYSLVMWNEAFVALNDTGWGQRSGFDQNRLFLGLAWQAWPGKLRLEGGYTNRWIVRPGADQVDHIAALNAFASWR
jgi:hypothetical protein